MPVEDAFRSTAVHHSALVQHANVDRKIISALVDEHMLLSNVAALPDFVEKRLLTTVYTFCTALCSEIVGETSFSTFGSHITLSLEPDLDLLARNLHITSLHADKAKTETEAEKEAEAKDAALSWIEIDAQLTEISAQQKKLEVRDCHWFQNPICLLLQLRHPSSRGNDKYLLSRVWAGACKGSQKTRQGKEERRASTEILWKRPSSEDVWKRPSRMSESLRKMAKRTGHPAPAFASLTEGCGGGV